MQIRIARRRVYGVTYLTTSQIKDTDLNAYVKEELLLEQLPMPAEQRIRPHGKLRCLSDSRR